MIPVKKLKKSNGIFRMIGEILQNSFNILDINLNKIYT